MLVLEPAETTRLSDSTDDIVLGERVLEPTEIAWFSDLCLSALFLMVVSEPAEMEWLSDCDNNEFGQMADSQAQNG